MRTDRISNEKSELYQFLTGDSDNKRYLIRLVRERIGQGVKSVALCLRGGYASLYYRGNLLLNIDETRTGLVGSFNFRHARFTKTYRNILETLSSMKVKISGFSDEPNQEGKKSVKFYLTGKKAVNGTQLQEILSIYMKLIDDYADDKLQDYAFDPKDRRGRSKSSNLEFDRKQQLFAEYFFGKELLYYDLEYTEHNAARQGVHGRYDLLGLERNGDGYTMLFVELKSKSSACGGKSGIIAHEGDYVDYLDSPLAENRKKEACENIKLLYDILEHPYPEHLSTSAIKGMKIKFVFSNNAVCAGGRYFPKDPRIEKVYIPDDSAVEQKY